METYNSIEVTRQLVKDGKISQEIAETIFPQLKESEDERIKNFLIGKFREIGEVWHEYSTKDIIAWLEKQGEQKEQRKHVWTLQDAAPGDILNSTRVQATIIFKGFNPDGKHIDAYCALQKGIFIHQELPWDMDFEPAPRFWIAELFRRMNESGYMWNPEMEELKKIEQEPAWSGEDERSIRDSIFYLESAKKYFEKDDNILWDEKWFNSCVDWLKSLKERYTWKPSEEQMTALSIIKDSGNSHEHEILDSLYYDLKKLK